MNSRRWRQVAGSPRRHQLLQQPLVLLPQPQMRQQQQLHPQPPQRHQLWQLRQLETAATAQHAGEHPVLPRTDSRCAATRLPPPPLRLPFCQCYWRFCEATRILLHVVRYRAALATGSKGEGIRSTKLMQFTIIAADISVLFSINCQYNHVYVKNACVDARKYY